MKTVNIKVKLTPPAIVNIPILLKVATANIPLTSALLAILTPN